jgi:hypothetical protein
MFFDCSCPVLVRERVVPFPPVLFVENLETAVTSALNRLKELTDDQSAAVAEAEAALTEGFDAYSTLLPVVQRVRMAKRAAAYESVVDKVQTRLVEMENAVTRQNFAAAVDSYVALVSLAERFLGENADDEGRVGPKHLHRYLMETTSRW